jgi:hypothetical protein
MAHSSLTGFSLRFEVPAKSIWEMLAICTGRMWSGDRIPATQGAVAQEFTDGDDARRHILAYRRNGVTVRKRIVVNRASQLDHLPGAWQPIPRLIGSKAYFQEDEHQSITGLWALLRLIMQSESELKQRGLRVVGQVAFLLFYRLHRGR